MDYDGLDTLYIYSCIFSLLAFLLTFFGLELHIAYESNKIMAFVITNYGWVGAFWVKTISLFFGYAYYKTIIHFIPKFKLRIKSKYKDSKYLKQKLKIIDYIPFFIVIMFYLVSFADFINNIVVVFM